MMFIREGGGEKLPVWDLLCCAGDYLLARPAVFEAFL